MTKLQINITSQVLEASKYCGLGLSGGLPTKSCAISVAIREIFPTAEVSNTYVHFKHPRIEEVKANLPEEAKKFIIEFDCSSPEQRAEMTPFSFEIDIPDVILEEISLEELSEALKGSTTMELVEA